MNSERGEGTRDDEELGEGTTFTLLLPATERPVEEDKTPAAVVVRGT